MKYPLKKGTKWDNYEIVDENADLPSSIPTNESEVLKVERVTDKQIEEFYYTKVFGLIKYKCVDKSSGDIIEEFQIKEYEKLSN